MKQTAVEWLMQQLPTIDKYDPYYQNLFTQAKEMEKEQIVIAEIETLRVIEKYGISSIEPLINELKNQIETFKSE